MAEQEKPICTVDPVCNLDLAAQHGQFMYDFEDVTYYFCSELCKNEFIRQPERFVKKSNPDLRL
ncbi:MAG: YHS domain-containing protein [Desulfobaccales bacterium]